MSTSISPYTGEQQSTFNPSEHLIQIKSKQGNADYLPVQFRLVWFRTLCPQGTIDTEEIIVDLDRECEAEIYAWNQDTKRSEKTLRRAAGYARFRATVTDGKGGRATATKTERAVDFPDYVEKAETGAVGRALAMLGYGTQFIGDDLNEAHRIVDAPVEKRQPSEQERQAYQQRKPFVEGSVAKDAKPEPTAKEVIDSAPASPQQVSSVRKLCLYLGILDPENVESMTLAEAKALIDELKLKYNSTAKEDRIPMDIMAAFTSARDRAIYLQVTPVQWDEIMQRVGKITSLDSVLKIQAELGTLEKSKSA